MRHETHSFDDDGRFPNSRLPVILYHGVDAARDAGSCERLFAEHGWRGAWRDGIFDFHHFHSTAHEVLGIVRGHVDVIRDPDERDEVLANISRVPLPDSDPVRGKAGPLAELWGIAG